VTLLKAFLGEKNYPDKPAFWIQKSGEAAAAGGGDAHRNSARLDCEATARR
jgi:hypothetical protein